MVKWRGQVSHSIFRLLTERRLKTTGAYEHLFFGGRESTDRGGHGRRNELFPAISVNVLNQLNSNGLFGKESKIQQRKRERRKRERRREKESGFCSNFWRVFSGSAATRQDFLHRHFQLRQN